MKPIIRNLLFIILVLHFLFLTGCSSYWVGFAAVLQVTYGVTTAVTDHDVRPACDAPDIVIIPWPPEPEIPDGPVSDPETTDNHDSESSNDRENDPQKKSADESDSRQSEFLRRPFARR